MAWEVPNTNFEAIFNSLPEQISLEKAKSIPSMETYMADKTAVAIIVNPTNQTGYVFVGSPEQMSRLKINKHEVFTDGGSREIYTDKYVILLQRQSLQEILDANVTTGSYIMTAEEYKEYMSSQRPDLTQALNLSEEEQAKAFGQWEAVAKHIPGKPMTRI